MNPFFDDMPKKKVVSDKDDDSLEVSTDSEENVKVNKKETKRRKGDKHKHHGKKEKPQKKSRKETSSDDSSEDDSSDISDNAPKQTKIISDDDRSAYISRLVDYDKAVVRKAMKYLSSFKNDEIKADKLIDRLIKLCGVKVAEVMIKNPDKLYHETSLISKLEKANEDYNWPNLITSIEDQFKEEKYEDNDDEATKKLVSDYNDIRKNGSKLKRKVASVQKRLDKKSELYKQLRNQKKTLDSLQEECDRCIDQADVDVEELGELILQYTECMNAIINVLNEPMDLPDDSDSDSDIGKHKKVRMPKFDDEDEDDFNSESDKVRIRNRKAVYKAIVKEPNGKLSMSHITLDPRAQAGIPLPVKKGEVIGFGWKEETGSRMLFRSVLSINNDDDNVMEIIPLQVRISEYHMILRLPESGTLRLGWDNSLSLRKSKEIDIFVKRFNPDAADAVMAAEEKRQEAWRQVEKSDLVEGNMEGGRLTLKLTARVMTEDGVKYTCHCDWESSLNQVKAQWDVQYPYLVWLEWYQTLKGKYPSHINLMAPFSGTAFMTTKAVVEERLTKINEFFQDLVQDSFMMETPEVVCWFRCQENIRLAKKEYYETFRAERAKQKEEEEKAQKKREEEMRAAMPNEEDMFDPLSYLCALYLCLLNKQFTKASI